jgi:hypothetical protein
MGFNKFSHQPAKNIKVAVVDLLPRKSCVCGTVVVRKIALEEYP